MEDRTKKILMAAGAGIVLAYFFSRPAAAAETGGDKRSLGAGGGRNLPDGGGGDGGSGGGGGGDPFPKSTLYGSDNVRAYQTRMAQMFQGQKDYLVNYPDEAKTYVVPGVDGKWGGGTQAASDAFITLVGNALTAINDDPTAQAMYFNSEGSFRFIKELLRDLPASPRFKAIVIEAPLKDVEAAFVKGAGRFTKRSVSTADHWAFRNATGHTVKYNLS